MPLLQVRSLTKRYGSLLVTDEVVLDVEPGELHALIGPNGAGKTTLVNQISGELPSDTGTIHFDGRDVTSQAIATRAQVGLVRSYQISSVFDEFTVLENAALAARAAHAGVFGFWRQLLEDRGATRSAQRSIAAVGLSGREHVTAQALGYGERRQLELAMALAAEPKFLLLDEPMAGMSVQESSEVVALLRRLKRDYTILLVEHDMAAVFALADRISVLVHGRILMTGTPAEIRRNEQVRATYLGDEELQPS
ncbi:ATP-binding cassette domain-containing protein [Variovorax paradoxus]|uniref:ATP-binding cassette domain-containing protein n=1 Tax=Variovorax paradoxus TaxID=34073 RepID=A0A5Q0M8E5_VARPD|nr:ABC transporter ATP-binding protein [Variovorax paradoxus]QFZ85117.1 ATP-binding cassette domain-containing protein [Variovorax paradoxus]